MTITKTHMVGYLGYIAIGLACTIIGPAIPFLIDEFNMSFSMVGFLFFVQGVAYFISVLAGGIASDFFGKKPFLLIGALLLTAGLAGFILGRSELVIFFSIALVGIGFGGLDGGINGLFIDISGNQKGLGLGLLHMFFGIGAFCGPLVFNLVTSIFHNWRFAFLGTSCVSALFFFLLLPMHLLKTENKKVVHFYEVGMLFKSGIIIQFILILFIYVGLEQAIAGWLPTYMIGTRDTTHAIGSLTLSLFFIGLTSGRLIIGMISEKVGYSRTLVILSMGTAVFLILIFVITESFPTIMFFFLSGLCMSGIFPTVMAQAGCVFPQHSGSISGILASAGGIGSMSLPLFMGIVSDHAGLNLGLLVPLNASVVMLILTYISYVYLRNMELKVSES